MKGKLFWLILALAIAAMVGIFMLTNNSSSSGDSSAATSPQEITPADHITGNPKARNTLVEYVDYQCSACGAIAPTVERVIKEYKDDLRIVFRHFPLTSIHPNGFASSRAAEAAGAQDKFWEMTHLLFSRQSEWSESTSPLNEFKAYAAELKLDVNKFSDGYNSQTTTSRINRDISFGNKLGVDSTPTFYLNDKVITPSPNFEAFSKQIDAGIKN